MQLDLTALPSRDTAINPPAIVSNLPSGHELCGENLGIPAFVVDLIEELLQAGNPPPSVPTSRPVPTEIREEIDSSPSSCRVGPVELRVLDPEGKPSAGAAVGFGISWYSLESNEPLALHKKVWRTNGEGVFLSESFRECVCPTIAYAVDPERLLAGFTVVDNLSDLNNPISIRLQPARWIEGRVRCDPLPLKGVGPDYISVHANPGNKPFDRTLSSVSRLEHFRLLVPPGDWTIVATVSGSNYNVPTKAKVIAIPAGKDKLVLDDIEIGLSGIVSLLDQEAPKWEVSKWHGGNDISLAKLRGKYVLLSFFQCGSMTDERLPEILDLAQSCPSKVVPVLISFPLKNHTAELLERLREMDADLAARFEEALKGGKFQLGFDSFGPPNQNWRGMTAANYESSPFCSFLINPDGRVICGASMQEMGEMKRWLAELGR
ncbi:MAG: hypothetical protein DCC75_08215 [Proteobacteria bacterium]|nr:MAG: hypothetical protein DCC75_08215 [Pseudomonadota bacterium]